MRIIIKKKKQFINKIKTKIATTFLISSSILSSFAPFIETNNTYAKDASHTGMTYLEVKINTGANNLLGVVNTEGQFNSWGGSDVAQSSEYKKEKIIWGAKNWSHIQSILKSDGKKAPNVPDDTGTSGGLFTTKNEGSTFKDRYDKLKTDGKGKKDAVSLTLSFPGWGAGDRIPDVSSGNTSVKTSIADGDRNNKDNKTFRSIDGTAASNSAAAVNNKLVSSLNEALADFTSQMRTTSNQKVQLSREGVINAVWLLANGYFPKDGKTVKYNENTGTISTENLVKGKIKVLDANAKKVQAGDVLAKIVTEGGRKSKETGKDGEYNFAVVKGYQAGVGDKSSDTYATDAYGLSWYDIAMSISAQVAYNTVQDESKASSTVVADQVDSYFYGFVSGVLGLFKIQRVDEIVFGNGGNLLKSGVFNILMTIQTPFIIASILILSLVIFDAYRKANMKYLSTGEQQSIMSSAGRVANALLAISLTPLGVMLLIYLDQSIVKFALGLNDVFAGYNYGSGGGADALKFLVHISLFGLGVDALMAFILAGVDIKYTWRYIARAISFALYFCVSPILFALDALKSNGRLFEFGQSAGMIWKNLTGTILMRGLDALGLVFSLQLSKLLFGSSILIKIMALLSSEAVSNSIMNMFGVSDASIKGISQAGQDVFNKGKTALLAGATTAAAAIGTGGITAMKSGRNYDRMQLNEAMNSSTQRNKAGDLQSEEKIKLKEKKNKPKEKRNLKNSVNNTNTGAVEENNQKIIVDSSEENLKESSINVVPNNGLVSLENDNETISTESGVKEVINNGLIDNNNENSTESRINGVTQVKNNPISSSGWGKLFNKKENNNVIDDSEKKNTAWNYLKQGYTNRGLHGDKNTIAGGGIQTPNLNKLDPNDFKVDPITNRIKPANFNAWKKSVGRDLGRFVGGATATMTKNGGWYKIPAASMFAASSTFTKGNLDNIASAAITANMMEKTITGVSNSSVAGNFSRSFLGRSLGMSPGAFTFDEVLADGSQFNSVLGGENKKVESPYKIKSVQVGENNQNLLTNTSFGNDVRNQDDKNALKAASLLHSRNNNGIDTGGVTTMSRDEVIEKIDDNEFNQINPQYAQLAQYMTKNGYDTMRFDGEEVGFLKTLDSTNQIDLENSADGSYERFLKQSLHTNGGDFTDGDIHFKMSAGDDEKAIAYQDQLKESREILDSQYSQPIYSAIKSGNSEQLKSLLREENHMINNPKEFLKKYPDGIKPEVKKTTDEGTKEETKVVTKDVNTKEETKVVTKDVNTKEETKKETKYNIKNKNEVFNKQNLKLSKSPLSDTPSYKKMNLSKTDTRSKDFK